MNLVLKYTERKNQIESKISDLRRVLHDHESHFEVNCQNIGFLIDLENLDNRLDELLHFTSKR